MVPSRPPPYGSIIKSSLYRASEMSHPCIYRVCIESPWDQLQHSIHLCVTSILLYSSLAFIYTALSLTIPHLSNWPSPSKWIQLMSSQPYISYMTREVISPPLILFPSIVIPRVNPSVTLLWYLVPLLRLPHCLNSDGPSFVDFSTFISKVWPRGQCTLFPDFIFVRYLESCKGNDSFPLTLYFLMYSTPTPYCTIENHTLDASVIQTIVPVILGCVWDDSNLMREWPFR